MTMKVEDHACMTGDCPHTTQVECVRAAITAQLSAEQEIEALIGELEVTPDGTDKRPCKRCGMPLHFIVGPKGKNIPGQRVRSVYALIEEPDRPPRLSKIEFTEGQRPTYVNHFETCPSAREFSRRNRRGSGNQGR